MKKKSLLTLLLCLLLLSLLPLTAFAEGKTAAERGYAAIMATGHGNMAVLPQEESYLEEWKTLYARKAWYAPNLYTDSAPAPDGTILKHYALCEGTRVTVVAEENDMSCILFESVGYKNYVGWIPSIRLLEAFPGEQYLIGTPQNGVFGKIDTVALRWSDGSFPGSDQHFTQLDEPLSGCVGFTFQYQLIAENNMLPDGIFGPRTLYVHDAAGWHALGSFPYDALGAVEVQVWLDTPMELDAFATVADCRGANVLDFRQTAMDYLIAPAQ